MKIKKGKRNRNIMILRLLGYAVRSITANVLRIYAIISRFFFMYKTWINMREKSKDEYGEKLCYCGHTHKCTCSNPGKTLFKESVKRGSIILWDKNNGW